MAPMQMTVRPIVTIGECSICGFASRTANTVSAGCGKPSIVASNHKSVEVLPMSVNEQDLVSVNEQDLVEEATTGIRGRSMS